MEKLLNLLNEKTNSEWVLGSNMNGDYLFVKGDKDNKFYEETIISKKFGFIERLVKNDKIKLPSSADELPLMYGYDYNSNECKSDRLTMLLSIQDNPIEFLISILK